MQRCPEGGRARRHGNLPSARARGRIDPQPDCSGVNIEGARPSRVGRIQDQHAVIILIERVPDGRKGERRRQRQGAALHDLDGRVGLIEDERAGRGKGTRGAETNRRRTVDIDRHGIGRIAEGRIRVRR